MTAMAYQSFVTSKPFVVIGPGKTVFYVHAGLLAQTSPVFRVDVEGGMREKYLETIEIQAVDGDVDDDTVGRFVEYTYTGEYTVPGPDIVQLPTDSADLQEAFKSTVRMEEDEWTFHGKKSKKDKKKKSSMSIWGEESKMLEEPVLKPELDPEVSIPAQEHETVLEVPGPVLRKVDSDRLALWETFRSQSRSVWRPAWQPRANSDDREDYTGVFLCHARLYKFADRYNCEELMTLALQRLRLTLCKYKMYPLRMGDITELVRYTYAHTVDHENRRDKCRAAVLQFVLCYFHELVEYQPFLQLLQEGGPLSSDCLAEIAKLVS